MAHSLACSMGARGGSPARSFLTVDRPSIFSRQRQKAGYLGYMALASGSEAERKSAGQKIEVRQRKFGTEKVLLPVREGALRNCQPDLDLRPGMRHNFLVGWNSKFGKDVPFVRDVVDHIGVVIRVYGADPLVHARSIADILWL